LQQASHRLRACEIAAQFVGDARLSTRQSKGKACADCAIGRVVDRHGERSSARDDVSTRAQSRRQLEQRLERQAAPGDLRGEVIARAESTMVAEAVAALGAKYPAVFWKRYGEGRTETEIAKDLGLSIAAVKTRAFRARQAAVAALRLAV